MAERCHGGVKTVIQGTKGPRRLSGLDTVVCPNKAMVGRSYCESCLALAMARVGTVNPGPEAGLRWPGVTTGVHVRQRGTYAKRATQ